MSAKQDERAARHLDGLTPDHPVGTGVGAAGGAVAGATAGSVMGGPVGAALGGVIGAVAGGLVGYGVAETADPARDRHALEEALRLREEQASSQASEPALDRQDESFRTQSRLTWAEARHAARAGWERFERSGAGERREKP